MEIEPNLLSRQKIASLLVTQALVVIPVLLELPLWIAGLWLTISVWRWQILRGKWPASSKRLTSVITLMAALALYIQFAGKVGVEAALALLSCTYTLKSLEMRNLRDGQLLIFIGFIVTATQLMLSQTMEAGIYALSCCALLIGSWRGLYLNRHKTLKQSIKPNLTFFFQALPVMMLLFIVVPRIGPLWTMPNDTVNKTGFSDNLSLGGLSSLVQNHEAAFRVSFQNEKPSQEQLYWRGLILNQFDGTTWTYLHESKAELHTPSENSQTTYEVILEPHGYKWLFGLGHAITAKSNSNDLQLNQNGLIRSSEIVVKRLQYDVTSYHQNPSLSELTDNNKITNLQLPEGFNPQTRAMVNAWLDEGMSSQQIIDAMRQKIATEFTYTLQPTPLGKHAIDEFLFNTRQGFCEHYASSFVFVLRAAGIPARLVVGYQGGIWNEIEDYLLVSQADAHAWVEVWLDNRWQMFDPTAAVAPNRIQTGIDQALPQQDQTLLSRRWQSSPWLWAVQKRWDAASYAWQKFVLNYDNRDRDGLLQKILGGTDPWRIGLILIALICTIALLLTFSYWWRQRPVFTSQEDKIIAKLKSTLQQRGYQIHPGESLSAFCRRVASREPGLTNQLSQIAKESEKILYAAPHSDLEKLKHLVYQLK